MRITLLFTFLLLRLQPAFGQNFHKDSILLVNYKDSALAVFSLEGYRFLKHQTLSDLIPYQAALDPSLDRAFSTLKPITLKNQIYFIYPGGGIVYKFSKGSIKRIDAAFKFNNSYNAKIFVYKDALFSLGGYGFWTGIDYLTQYNEILGTWSIVNTTGELPGSILEGSFILLGNELWVVNFSNKITNTQTLKNIPNAYVLNLDTRVWKRKDVINEKFSNLFTDNESYKSIAIKDSLYFFSAEEAITAKIHIPSNKVVIGNTSNLLSNLGNDDQLISFRDSIYYATYKIQGQKDRVRIVSLNAHPSFIVKEDSYFQRNNKVIILYGSFLTIAFMGLIIGMLFFLKGRKNRYTLEKGILSNGIKNVSVSQIEGAIYFLKQLSEKGFITNNDMLTYFNDEGVSLDMITKRKNKMVHELETILSNKFKRILFERVRDPNDHRQANYKLKKGKSIICYTA